MSESAAYFIRVLGMFMLILLLVFILAVITPKLANKIDKLIGKFFKKKSCGDDDNIYKVRGIYDSPKKIDGDKKNSDNNSDNDVPQIKATGSIDYSEEILSSAEYGGSEPHLTELQTGQSPNLKNTFDGENKNGEE